MSTPPSPYLVMKPVTASAAWSVPATSKFSCPAITIKQATGKLAGRVDLAERVRALVKRAAVSPLDFAG
jgi:hypothetical protein